MNIRNTLGLAALALSLAAPTAWAGGHGHSSGKNIVETAAEAGQFNTLITAAKAAGLVGALTGDDALTVFAPTDEAFKALPAGTVEGLLKPENKDQLVKILTYHVIAGEVGSSALADGARLDTLAGETAVISQAEDGFLIQNARIIATDIDASNGVVHVIDRVILPPERTTSVQAERLIKMAIDHGAPMYNHGNPQATVAAYTMVSESLMSLGELSRPERMRLKSGLSEAGRSEDPRVAAWALRYALDDVRASLHGQPMSMDTMTASN